MTSPEAWYSELVAALDGPDQPSGPARESESAWEAVLRELLPCEPSSGRSRGAVAAREAAGLIDPVNLAAITPTELRDLLGEAGISVPLKTAALVPRIARWFVALPPLPETSLSGPGDLASRFREQLLAIHGVGPGKADAILLALGYARFPIDPGIYRILVRHGWCDITADYEEASERLAHQAGADLPHIDRLSRQLSRVARRFCGIREPKCQHCPLRTLLPASGPIDPHG